MLGAAFRVRAEIEHVGVTVTGANARNDRGPIDADIVPLPGARITSFDKDIGRVTSATFSPSANRVVGLGYVHRDFTAAGTDVTVVWNEARVKAIVQ